MDPDETPHSVASHLGLLCLLRPVCLNTCGKYSSSYEQNADLIVVVRRDMPNIITMDMTSVELTRFKT